MASLVNLTEKPLSKLHLSEITIQASKKRKTIIEIPIKLIGSIGLARCKMNCHMIITYSPTIQFIKQISEENTYVKYVLAQ